ncbi:MAG: SRPBCC family protein [Crocinitomicaceae bacterium]|nr:SRPBCC family protein [Crocinitomicaceae bacterium]
MKYQIETTISQNINLVLERFQDPEGIKKWQRGFISLEHLSGTPGETGSKSKLKFRQGKRNMEVIETITTKQLPEKLITIYETKGVWNEVITRFKKIENEKTLHTSEITFKMKGMLKIMGWIMPGMFKKQSKQYMDDFKYYAETGSSLF